MVLEFKDIGDWTPSSVSIVDVPYHPLAYFEVYENDEEFVKKFATIEEKVTTMSNEQQNSEKNVTMSESFFEKLFGGLVAKRDPAPERNITHSNKPDNDEVSNKEILEAIEKLDGRVTAIEEGANNTEENNNNEDSSQNPPANPEEDNNSDDSTQKTVELPLNDDGTLNMGDGVVAKYLPRGSSFSQSVDGDLTRGEPVDKSLNERSGRSESGMTW